MTAYLQMTLAVPEEKRSAAAAVYVRYRRRFLDEVKGAVSKELLVRDEDVQVLHRFVTDQDAWAYLSSGLLLQEIMPELTPLTEGEAEIRIYTVIGD